MRPKIVYTKVCMKIEIGHKGFYYYLSVNIKPPSLSLEIMRMTNQEMFGKTVEMATRNWEIIR